MTEPPLIDKAAGLDQMTHGDHAETNYSSESPGRLALRRFWRHRLARFGAILLATIVLAVLLSPIFIWHDPSTINLNQRGTGPSLQHPFGTDRTGRDVFARVLYGGRISLFVGVVTMALAAIVGITVGAISGFFGRWVDATLMRVVDIVLTFPALVIIIALVAVLGPGVRSTIIALSLLRWPQIARIVRGEFLRLREADFVLAAENAGASPRVIITRHLLPNVIGPVTVALTLLMADAILLEAALSFLGLGIQVPDPSWGNMLQDAQSINVLENLPWMWIFPGVFIMATVLTINFVGDGLRDALDPRSGHG